MTMKIGGLSGLMIATATVMAMVFQRFQSVVFRIVAIPP